MSTIQRKLISFDSNIFKEASEKSGGKFTPDQVMDVWEAAVAYIHHVLRFTAQVGVRLPFLGTMFVNVHEMISRRDKLLRIKTKAKNWDKKKQAELDAITEKIEYLSQFDYKKGDPYIRHTSANIRSMRKGMKFEEIQNIQNKKFR